MIKAFPVVELELPELPQRFRLWASQFGIFRLGRSLGVDSRSVRRYLHSGRPVSPAIVRKIIALSRVEPLDGSPLTYEDFYGPAQVARVEVRTVQKAQEWE